METDTTYIDVTDATFQAEVLERSSEMPVVVDLWAPWCGPCRQIGPLLEDIVAATGGKVVLAKVNVDENPTISQVFKVQSIPAVHAVKDRKVVASFVGAQGRTQIEAFVQKLLPTQEEDELSRLLAAGDEASLRAVLEVDAGHPGAVVALAEILAGDGRGDEALQLLARIPETAETRRVAALARQGSDLGEDDIETRLVGLLEQVRDDDEARKTYVDLLELLGPDDPRTAEFRKRLTARLY